MPDLADGETTEIQGSGASPYVLRNTGGVYSCSCPAWRNQSTPIETRTCKHLRKFRGEAAETERLGGALPQKPLKSVKTKIGDDGSIDECATEGPPILLAHSWDNFVDLSDWWISEKLDGVRAYWDGKQFISRQGNLYHAPDWFVEKLPDTPLDGELWIDRKKFQRTVGIVRRQDKSEHWREVRFLAFDAPSMKAPFEDRMAFLAEIFEKSPLPFASAHQQWKCQGLEHLQQELARVESLGGEGLMLRQPGSLYEIGRSMTLLKIKTFHDAEAVVVGHTAGAGKHAGRVGALNVRLPNGVEFSVGTGLSDKERQNPPAIGSTITFRYQELSDGGVPRFPSYAGIRTDAPATISAPVPPQSKPAAKPVSVPVKAATTQANSAASSAGKQRFEFTGGAGGKFWEIERVGNEMTTWWGKIGTNGQSKTKPFPTEAAAEKEADALVREKTGKGYTAV